MTEIIQLVQQLPGVFGVILGFFLLVLLLLWALLPFAVIGTNKRLTELIEINKRIAQRLETASSKEIAQRAKSQRQEPILAETVDSVTTTCPKCQKLVSVETEVCGRCGARIRDSG